MTPKKYNEAAWWVGGLLVVALLISIVYVLASGITGTQVATNATSAPLAVATTATPTAAPTATPVPATDTTAGVGPSAPATITSLSDLQSADTSLDASDPSAITSGLDQTSTELGAQ